MVEIYRHGEELSRGKTQNFPFSRTQQNGYRAFTYAGPVSGSAQTIPIMPSRTVRASFWATVDRAGDRAAGVWVRWVLVLRLG